MRDAILISCGVLGAAGFVISCICVSMVAGFLRSTHTVQYVPHDNTDVLDEMRKQDAINAENEKALLASVGRKKKDQPTVVEDLDSTIEEINKTELKF